VPADLRTAMREPVDPRQQGWAEVRLRRLDRVDVDAHAADAKRVEFSQQRVGRIRRNIDDSAADGRIKHAHGVEHAGIVLPIGAGLYENVARQSERFYVGEIVVQLGDRRCIAQIGADRVFRRRAKDVEMRVAIPAIMLCVGQLSHAHALPCPTAKTALTRYDVCGPRCFWDRF
jgi:hypothetical protein